MLEISTIQLSVLRQAENGVLGTNMGHTQVRQRVYACSFIEGLYGTLNPGVPKDIARTHMYERYAVQSTHSR